MIMSILSGRGVMPSLHSLFTILVFISTLTSVRADGQFRFTKDATATATDEGLDFPYNINSIAAQATVEIQCPATVANIQVEVIGHGVNVSEANDAAVSQRDKFIAWLKELSPESITITQAGDVYGWYSGAGRWAGQKYVDMYDTPIPTVQEVQQYREISVLITDLNLVGTIVRFLANKDAGDISVSRLTYAVAENEAVAFRRELYKKAMQELMREAKLYEDLLELRVTSVEELSVGDIWQHGSTGDVYGWDAVKYRFADSEAGVPLEPAVTMQSQNVHGKLIMTPRPRREIVTRVGRGLVRGSPA